MRRALVVWIALLGLVPALAVAASAPPADADPPEKKTTESAEAQPEPEVNPWVHATKGKKTKSPAKVYSNEDLERMFGGGAPSAGTPSAAQAPASRPAAKSGAEDGPGAAELPDALSQMFEQEAARSAHAEKVAAAEKGVEQARQKLVDAEKRQLATRNPLLARPGAPEEGAEAWEQADGAGRAEQSESMVAAAREALATAERELADLRRANP